MFKATDKWSDRIALRALIRSAREIAQGVWHLHNSGVIHGDMKPVRARVWMCSSACVCVRAYVRACACACVLVCR